MSIYRYILKVISLSLVGLQVLGPLSTSFATDLHQENSSQEEQSFHPEEFLMNAAGVLHQENLEELVQLSEAGNELSFDEGMNFSLKGDGNGDGKIDLVDFAAMKTQFGISGLSSSDMNEDGVVNLADFALLKQAFGKTIDLPKILKASFSEANVLMSLLLENGTELKFDEAGLLQSIEDGNIRCVYNDAGALQAIEFASPQLQIHLKQSSSGQIAIDQVVDGDGNTYRFGQSENKVFTFVQNAAGQTLRLKMWDKTNQTSTHYTFNEQGQVLTVHITRDNTLLEQLSYTYTDTRIIVQDREGILRGYDRTTKKLYFIKTASETYIYNYVQSDGTEVIQQKLYRKIINGWTYEFNEGALFRIFNGEGYEIRDIVLSSDGKITGGTATAPIADGTWTIANSQISWQFRPLTAEEISIIFRLASQRDHFTPPSNAWLEELMNADWNPDEVTVLKEYDDQQSLQMSQSYLGITRIYRDNKLRLILDANDTLLTEYVYDDNANLSSVTLHHARASLPSNVESLRQELTAKKAEALENLSNTENEAIQQIKQQVALERARIQSYINERNAELTELNAFRAQTSREKEDKARARKHLQNLIADANQTLLTLNETEITTLAELDQNLQSALQSLQTEEAQALAQIVDLEREWKESIVEQESTAIIYDVYRDILGRDPTQEEWRGWLATTTYDSAHIDRAALEQTLRGTTELQSRTTFVTQIINALESKLNTYLAASPSERLAIEQSLQLDRSQNEIASLVLTDAPQVLNKLKNDLQNSNLHFGQSAFKSLEHALTQANVAYNSVELASQLIWVDILSGVLTPLDTEDLVISAFAIQKVAKLYDVDIATTQLTWDELQTSQSTGKDVIVHISDRHYVIVQEMTDSSITFLDPSIGSYENPESVTVSKEGFLKEWKGYALVPAELAPTDSHISAQEAKTIRGAFWGSLFNFIGSVLSFTPLSFLSVPFFAAGFVASLAEGDYLNALTSAIMGSSGLGSWITSALSSIVPSAAQALTTMGHYLSHTFESVLGVTNILKQGLNQFIQSAGSFSTTLGGVTQVAIEAGLNIASEELIEELDFVPDTYRPLIARLISSEINLTPTNPGTLQPHIEEGIQIAQMTSLNDFVNSLDSEPNIQEALGLIRDSVIDQELPMDLLQNTLSAQLKMELEELLEITQSIPSQL